MMMAVLLILLALLQLKSGFSQLKGCPNSADCGADQCCMSPLNFNSVGYCSPRRSDGNNCYVRNDHLLDRHNGTLYYGECPCQDGQECVGTGVITMTHGEMGRCRPRASKRQAERPCLTSEQCSADECCVMHVTVFGRKRRGIAPGNCRKLKTSGETCYVHLVPSHELNVLCSCLPSLHCRGIGQIEQPFGEKGVCS